MYLPKDIVNIIFFYKKQLDLISINKEFRMKVKYNYSSQFFSQISFNEQTISYYLGKDKLLCKIANPDTFITILR